MTPRRSLGNMLFKCSIFGVLSLLLHAPGGSTYQLAKEHRGLTFFDDWDFFGSIDYLTHGDVNWLDQGSAFNSHLAYVNSDYNVILKVDNGYVPYGARRNSVRIEARTPFYVGTVLVADFLHLPYGCSVWPAWWSTGPTWPENGEIDIIEQINGATNNQMALHSLPGCFQSVPIYQTGKAGGQLGLGSDCSTPAGCVVQDASPVSFGAPFAAAGGGVYAVQLDVEGLFMWFWTRSAIPAELTAAVQGTGPLNISSWGPPSAAYMATGCNITEFFSPQRMILDITLCGVWAGEPTNYAMTCGNHGPTGRCYDDNVPGDGRNYDEAYFEIKYIRQYTTGGAGPIPTPAVPGAVWNNATASAATATVTSYGTLRASPEQSAAMSSSTPAFAMIIGVVGVMTGALAVLGMPW